MREPAALDRARSLIDQAAALGARRLVAEEETSEAETEPTVLTDVPAEARILREDGVWEVRAQAARALGRSGDPAAVPALEDALQDENEFVRSAAANALRVNEALREQDADDAS